MIDKEGDGEMLVKAFLTEKDKPYKVVPFLFNPNAFSVVKSNHYAEVQIPGLSAPIYQFVRGNARTVTMDLFFDTYELKTDVRLFTDRITGWDSGSMLSKMPGAVKGLMDIDSGLHAPPVCLFVWGAYVFQCIITTTTKKFTMFLPEGIPVRATVNITLKEYTEADAQAIAANKESSDLTKRWRVTEGDTLLSIAAKEYGDPKEWRLIADKNDLDNARILTPGKELMLPPKE